MHAQTDPIGEVREQAAAHLRELGTALVAHGFSVEVETKFWLVTATHAADVFAPARSQRVQLAEDDAGRLHWYLLSPAGDERVRCELLCPAADVAEAVERVARVLTEAGR